MERTTVTIVIALAAAGAVFGSTQAQQSPAPQVSLPPEVLDQTRATKLPENNLPAPVPTITGKTPGIIAPGADRRPCGRDPDQRNGQVAGIY